MFQHATPNSISAVLHAAAHPARTYHISERLRGAERLLNLTCSGNHTLPLSQWVFDAVRLAKSCIKQKPRNLRQVSEQGTSLSRQHPHPPLYTHSPQPLTPATICQKLSYKFLFVSIFKHDGEELSLYMRGSSRVYPAAPAPGNKRKPPLLLVEAGKGRRLWGWQEERCMETERERERAGERNSLSDSNLGTWNFYDFPAFGKNIQTSG